MYPNIIISYKHIKMQYDNGKPLYIVIMVHILTL